jgi:RNase H-fold protein (predicted Holliday junction resolvase)
MAKAKTNQVRGPIPEPQDPDGPGMIKAIEKISRRLYKKYWDAIVKYREDSDNQKVVVNLKTTLDYSKGDPQLKCDIVFSQKKSDSAQATVTDPKQGTFTVIESESNEPTEPEEEENEENKDKEPAAGKE